MFWVVPDDVVVDKNFTFNIYFTHDNEYDRKINHVFLNDDLYDGIMLMSKHRPISKREFDHRFPIERKEWDIVASHPRPYDRFIITNYEEYKNALSTSKTEMFWCVWPDIEIVDNSVFDIHFRHHQKYERFVNHVFLNGNFYDGLILASKHSPLSEKEINNRFLVNRKEWDILASKPLSYEKYYATTYDDYLKLLDTVTTSMFWVVPHDVDVLEDFNFAYQVPKYEQHITHIFKNGEYFDGVCLFSKTTPITKREFDNRFFIVKKEIDILASQPKPYDIVFISYNEVNADSNFKLLADRYPNAKRVHGVKGIHQAHIAAAKLSTTDMFWVIDGDATIVDDFNLTYHVPAYDKDVVHVWRSRNPINDLEYGYGGVKLLPRNLTINMDISTADMTTSISSKFKALNTVSNITVFNTDPFSTWKSAFRECAKLASGIIDRQESAETKERLDAWCVLNENVSYGYYGYLGALQGKQFGEHSSGELYKINDFEWLYERFSKNTV